MIITLDGPAGSGKSTVARALADRLGFRFLNTGAMYRAAALRCVRAGVELTDADACAAVAAGSDIRFEDGRLLAAGEDLTDALSDPAVGEAASAVAVHPPVRDALIALQRAVGEAGDTVTEGRDQGTVVFPHAALKIFLTAAPRDRAERRRAELLSAGRDVPLEAVLKEVEDRDARDAARPVGALKPAADAVRYDTTGKPVAAVVDELAALAAGRR